MPRPQRFRSSRTNFRIGVALAAIAVTSAGAYGHGGHSSAPTPRPAPGEIAAFEAAKPAFRRHCFRCHTSGGKKSKRKALAHIAMDRYPFTGHHAGEAGTVVRTVLGARGNKKATMPSDDPGVVTGDDLANILAWADAFDRAHQTRKDEAHAQ